MSSEVSIYTTISAARIAANKPVKLEFHDADTDTDTDTDIILERITARKSRVSDIRMYRRVGRVGVGVRVGVVECQLATGYDRVGRISDGSTAHQLAGQHSTT